MGGKSRICEICGRRERHNPGFFASFPKNEQRCRSWVQIVGNEDLVHIPIENLCAVRFICGDHFINKDFNKKGNRLKKRAYPKLQLLRQPLTDYQLRGFPAHVASKSVPAPVCSMDLTAVEPIASTSKTPLATATTQNKPAPTPVRSMDAAAINLGASTSKTPVATVTTQNILVPAPVCSMDLTAVEPIASTSKTPLATATTQNKPAPAPVRSMDAAAINLGASTSKTPVATVTTQNILVPAPVCTMDLTAVEPTASTSKTPLATATTQNKPAPAPVRSMDAVAINLGASTSKTPVATVTTQNILGASAPASVYTIEGTAGEPVVSRKTPLSTSTTQNIMVSASICSMETTAVEPQMSTGGTSLATSMAHNMIGVNTVQARLLEELKKVKATVRSLRRNAKLLEQVKSPMVKEIVASALSNQKRKPKGRRWTAKYKISCLAILKRSPKAYRYLRHLVPLPSVKTLQNILRRIPMETGISKPVLEHLRKIAASYGDDKYCCLLFDEMAIKPRLNYNKGKDEVDGFTDLGNSERTNNLADHALVFMIQGIKRKFKQPLAFYFVKGTISSAKLATIIKNIIGAVNAAGFKIVATICDQGPTNLGALKILKESSRAEECPQIKNYFDCNEEKIYTIFDVPHLFKSIRNNFLNSGQILMNGKKVKWEHLKKVEERNRNLLYLSKISETHVNPKYRAKMKVKYAAQTLSNTVAAVLKLLALATPDPLERQELMESGELIHDLDRLFDITNGPSGPNDVKKGQRENVSNKTNHLAEWADYRKKLETLRFMKPNGTTANVKCVQGYLTTLCSFRDLWVDLQRLGFKYLNLRQLNQDSLENFFGLLRQHSPTNRNPTVSSFVAALKTSVISGMTAPHSRGSNCEEDTNMLLTNLQNFVFGDQKTSEESIEEDDREVTQHDNNKENISVETGALLSIPDDEEDIQDIEESLFNLEGQAVVYVSGYIAMRISKNHKCHTCMNSLTTSNPGNDPTFSYIKLREWWKDREHLTYPTIGLCKYVENCVKIFENEVIPALHRDNISVFATTLFMTSHEASFIECNLHGSIVFQKISAHLAIVLIRRQCQRINTKISAQEDELADKTKKAQQRGIAK